MKVILTMDDYVAALTSTGKFVIGERQEFVVTTRFLCPTTGGVLVEDPADYEPLFYAFPEVEMEYGTLCHFHFHGDDQNLILHRITPV